MQACWPTPDTSVPLYDDALLREVVCERTLTCTVREFNARNGHLEIERERYSNGRFGIVGILGMEGEGTLWLDGKEVGPLSAVGTEYLPALGEHQEQRRKCGASEEHCMQRHGGGCGSVEVTVRHNELADILRREGLLPETPFLALNQYDSVAIAAADEDALVTVRGFNVQIQTKKGAWQWRFS